MPGPCVISTSNLLAVAAAASDLTVENGAGAALTAASGYLVADLYDGKVERAYRSGTSTAAHSLVFSIGSTPTMAFAYLGDVSAPSGTSVLTASLSYSNTAATGPWTLVGSIPLNSRGDGWLAFASVTAKHWLVAVGLSGAAVLDVGVVWIGNYVTLPKTFTTITRDPQRFTVTNESSAGTRFRARFGPKRERFGLEFSALTSTQSDAIVAVVDAADGGYNNVVLVPDSQDPAGGFHGTFDDASSESEDASRLHMGRSLSFTESARAI